MGYHPPPLHSSPLLGPSTGRSNTAQDAARSQNHVDVFFAFPRHSRYCRRSGSLLGLLGSICTTPWMSSSKLVLEVWFELFPRQSTAYIIYYYDGRV